MNQLGHWGIVLLVFGFVIFGLVVRDRTRAAKVVSVSALAVGIVPDLDLHVAAFAHRGVTHTLWAALLAGLLLAVVAWTVEPLHLTDKHEESFYGFVTGFFGVGTHLVGDVITPMGIKPLYPLVTRSYTLNLVSAHNQSANVALLVLGLITFQTSVRGARASDAVPTHSAGFRTDILESDADADTDV